MASNLLFVARVIALYTAFVLVAAVLGAMACVVLCIVAVAYVAWIIVCKLCGFLETAFRTKGVRHE